MDKFMLSPSYDATAFYGCATVEYSVGKDSWICAYMHMPWLINYSEEHEVSHENAFNAMGITYVGPGQRSWEYDSILGTGTWLGIDWMKREPKPTEAEIRAALQRVVDYVHKVRYELGCKESKDDQS